MATRIRIKSLPPESVELFGKDKMVLDSQFMGIGFQGVFFQGIFDSDLTFKSIIEDTKSLLIELGAQPELINSELYVIEDCREI